MVRFGGIKTALGATALTLALVPVLAAAQTPDFSIPGSRPSSNPRAQGPVDDEVPVIRSTPRPAASGAPRPAAQQPPPVITTVPPPSPIGAAGAPADTAPDTVQPTVTPRAPVAQPARVRPAPIPASSPIGGAGTPVSSDPIVALPTPVPTSPSASASDPFALPQASEPAPATEAVAASVPGWYWPWIAGAATALAALFGLLWWRRRKPAMALLDFEPPVVPQASAEPEPMPAPMPEPAPPMAAIPQPAPEPQPLPAAATGLAISLEARRMNASLVATTLNYVLRLTNTTDQPLSALAVEGDMVAAHGSLPPEQQIANDNQRLELRHALVTLAPGESAEFSGDFRLPLATLVPIRAGNAAYFVPLARWRIEASTPAGIPLVQVQTFVVGELPEQPGAALRPFRLDLGPRTYSRLGQRAVS